MSENGLRNAGWRRSKRRKEDEWLAEASLEADEVLALLDPAPSTPSSPQKSETRPASDEPRRKPVVIATPAVFPRTEKKEGKAAGRRTYVVGPNVKKGATYRIKEIRKRRKGKPGAINELFVDGDANITQSQRPTTRE